MAIKFSMFVEWFIIKSLIHSHTLRKIREKIMGKFHEILPVYMLDSGHMGISNAMVYR